MKKKNVFLFVLSLLFSIFVMAQDSVTIEPTKAVVIHLDTITLCKGDTKVVKPGKYELIFTTTKGLTYFKDLNEGSIMIIRFESLLSTSPLNVADSKGNCVPATVLAFAAKANDKFDIVFAIVLLDSDKSLYAVGITLSNFTILLKIPEDGGLKK